MKKNCLIFAVCLITQLFSKYSICQEYDILESLPVIKGCENIPNEKRSSCLGKKASAFILDSLKKVVNIEKAQNGGSFEYSFVISKDKSIIDITLTKSNGGNQYLKNLLADIIKGLPIIKPGSQRGRPVKVAYKIPINLKFNQKKANQKSTLKTYPPKTNPPEKYFDFHELADMPIIEGCEKVKSNERFDCFRKESNRYVMDKIKRVIDRSKAGDGGDYNYSFFITKTGKIDHIYIYEKIKGNSYLDSLFYSVIKEIPVVQEGRVRKRPVDVSCQIPIKLKIDSQDNKLSFHKNSEGFKNPVFRGCSMMSENKMLDCFFDKASNFISKKINVMPRSEYGRGGKYKILFTVSKNATTENIKLIKLERGNPNLEKVITKQVKKFPIKSPAINKGKAEEMRINFVYSIQ